AYAATTYQPAQAYDQASNLLTAHPGERVVRLKPAEAFTEGNVDEAGSCERRGHGPRHDLVVRCGPGPPRPPPQPCDCLHPGADPDLLGARRGADLRRPRVCCPDVCDANVCGARSAGRRHGEPGSPGPVRARRPVALAAS